MSDLEIIESVVSRTHARRRRQSAWRGAWTGLVIGAVCWLLTLLAYKLLPIPSTTLTVGAILGLAPIAIGLLVGWSRGPSTLETAQWVDQRENLHERLSTAMEISRGETSQAWRDLVLNDAGRCAERIDPKRMLPLRLPRTSRWALLTLALGAGLGFAPEYRSPLYLKQKHETAVIRDTGRQLVELTRRNLQKRPPALEPTRNALDSVMELGEHLAKAKLTRNDALKDLASVTDQIKEQARELGKNPAIKSLERAARTPNKGGAPGFAELQKKVEALQTALGNQKAGSEELEKLKEDLERAREAAAGMPGGDSPEARSAREGLARSLADLSKQAADLGISLPSLEEAIAALATAETERMIRDLEIAETDLEKLHQLAKKLEQLQMAAERMGKDLPEQLENGQTEVAQSTLKKMASDLLSNSLSPESAKKILEEVSRAIKPADPYGEAAKHLEQAAGQLTKGDPQAAAQSLAQAARELESIMEQMADVEALMASLGALQMAQMSIGNGQNWGSSQTPKRGKGGGGGAGVGTWADDSRWLELSDIRESWDNSGVVRPNEDARGVSDRGEGQLADNLAPTKVKGQITPGESMPSITLKGVSIKGMSKVDYTEVVTAAQAEAQSALNQDQVPRAYREAVREYFNDRNP
ncbi:MAG: hypothetical protein K9N62_14545 [Verrucomicrobia bacterium]|nr:hypothetical protein [Verrucomicrobiota bacterium]